MIEDVRLSESYELNDFFYFQECADCSGWMYNVTCNKSGKMGIINVTKCTNEVDFTVTATSLEEGCNIGERDFPKEKDALLRFLKDNFKRYDTKDPCVSFQSENEFCPTCDGKLTAI